MRRLALLAALLLPSVALADAASMDALKAWFAKHRAQPRLILFLSPT